MGNMLSLLHGRQNFKWLLTGIGESAASLREWMFEVEVHEVLRRGGAFHMRLLPRGKTASTIVPTHLPGTKTLDECDLDIALS
jgi:hypothetical protein